MNFSCSAEHVSKNEITPLAWSIRDPSPDNPGVNYGYICATATLLIFALGVPFNALIIVTIQWKKLYRSAMVIPMLSLCISNLLLCLLVVPFIIITGYTREFIFGPSDYVRCKVCNVSILNISLPLISIYSLALMSVGRVVYLKKPFHYDTIVTPGRVLAILVTLWSFGFVTSLPPLFGYGYIQFSKFVSACVPASFGSGPYSSLMYYNVVLITLALLGVVTTLIMYIWIVCIAQTYIFRHPKRFAMLHNESALELTMSLKESDGEDKLDTNLKNRLRKKQLQVVLVLVGIILANVTTWVPMMVLAMIPSTILSGVIPGPVYSVAYMCYLSQIIVHPLLQVFLVYELKETTVKLLKNIVRNLFKLGVEQ